MAKVNVGCRQREASVLGTVEIKRRSIVVTIFVIGFVTVLLIGVCHASDMKLAREELRAAEKRLDDIVHSEQVRYGKMLKMKIIDNKKRLVYELVCENLYEIVQLMIMTDQLAGVYDLDARCRDAAVVERISDYGGNLFYSYSGISLAIDKSVYRLTRSGDANGVERLLAVRNALEVFSSKSLDYFTAMADVAGK